MLKETWSAFHAEFAARGERLAAEYTAAWADFSALLDSITDLYKTLEMEAPAAGTLTEIEDLWRPEAQRLLLDPVAQFYKTNPLQRIIAAVQDYDTAVEDLIRRLPRSITATNADLLEMAGGQASRSWRGRLRRWRKKRKVELRLRDIMRDRVVHQSLNRLLADGNVQLVMARAAVHIVAPWQAWRRQTLSALVWTRPETKAFEAERAWWLRTAAELKARAGPALAACRTLAAQHPLELSQTLLRAPAKPNPKFLRKAIDRRRGCVSYWVRQQRSVQSLLHLETELLNVSSDATEEIKRSLESLGEEHAALLAELRSVIAWLRTPAAERRLEFFPPPQAGLASSEDRTRDFTRRVEERGRLRLPSTLELVEPRSALPALRSPWRQVAPHRIFLGFLQGTGAPVAQAGFVEAESGHQPILREIERAREVVAFGLEEARKLDASPGIAQEAAENALTLLVYQEQNLPDTVTPVERYLCQALGLAMLDTQVALERSWLGAWAYLTRQSTVRAMREIATDGLRWFQKGMRTAAGALHVVWRKVLVVSGWMAPPPPERQPVESVLQLRTVLEVNLGARDLPGIYTRLFRLAPVEDPRFLVGRDLEMAGLADAKARWQAGAAAAVMVVGSRGSGKTSLLNCAVSRLFTGEPVIFTNFKGRVVTADHLKAFLRSTLTLPEDADVIEALQKSRRVIILEEFERTFLRQMGGFAAVDEFLRILDATASNNLWIVSMNQAAFRYVSATTRLAECFTTRINATSVSPEALVGAILQRHNLSGYRLHFEPPPDLSRHTSRLRRILGLEPDRQQLFFGSLYEQSQGVFRSAFELWQDSIERVEGGVVYTRQPLDPDYQPLLRQLSDGDYFLLNSVMQHGSLTPVELACVLRIDQDQAWRRLRRLRDLEILEPEPASPGFRVKPQANRFVNEALYTRNLLPGGKQ